MFTTKQYRAKAVEYGELVKTSTGPNQREFQQLEQRFTVLADNEQWLADNYKGLREIEWASLGLKAQESCAFPRDF